jgi:hypothetical protein
LDQTWRRNWHVIAAAKLVQSWHFVQLLLGDVNSVIIIVAVLGIAYLLISMEANRYKREGLRLWLYRCNWGRGAEPKWLGDEGHKKQTYALLETLQRPSVLARALYHGGGSTPRKWLGFWVQIQLPIAVAGEEVTLQPAMIETTFLRSENRLRAMPIGFYEQFLNGNWVDPTQLGQLPNGPGGKPNPADFTYTKPNNTDFGRCGLAHL